jgi:hypothetical protein
MMRLICLHEDTVTALQRLGTTVEDLTPSGLWDTPYHLVTVSAEQRDALQRLRVTLDDVTPTALRDGAASGATAQASTRAAGASTAAGAEAIPSPT